MSNWRENYSLLSLRLKISPLTFINIIVLRACNVMGSLTPFGTKLYA